MRLLSDRAYAEEFDIMVDEITDQYVGAEFQGEERKRVEDYFFKSADRRDRLKFAIALKRARAEQESERPDTEQKADVAPSDQASKAFSRERVPAKPRWWQQKQRSTLAYYLPIAATVLIVLGLGFGVWRAFFYQSDVDKGLLALNAAYRNQRPIESRISALTYAPFSQTRGPGTERVNENDLSRAELTLLTALKDKPTPAGHHALGQVFLAKRQFDKAISEFGEALKGDPRNPRLLSDLGSALLELGKIESVGPEPGKGFEDFARGLANLNKALELDSNLLEALFNRALCHQLMGLRDQALNDWRLYLQRDSSSEWANEARERLKKVEQEHKSTRLDKGALYQQFLEAFAAKDSAGAWQAVRMSSCRTGNYLVEQLADEYIAGLAVEGDRNQNEKLVALSLVGELKADRVHDTYARDIARYYKHLTPDTASIILQARRLAALGQEQLASAKFAPALDSFKQAMALFQRVSDQSEALQCQYWMGICHQQLNHESESFELLNTVAAVAEELNYGWLVVRALNGLNTHYANDFAKSLEVSTKSLRIAQESGDSYGEASAFSQVIAINDIFGNQDRSLAYIQQALSSGVLLPLEAKQVWLQYSTIASTCYSLKLYDAAAEYQEAAITSSAELHDPSIQSMARTYLGMVYRGAGKYEAASRSFDESLTISNRYANEAFGKKLTAFTLLQVGELYRQSSNYDRALEAYNKSIELYESLDFTVFLYECHKGKLLTAIKSNNTQIAQTELTIAKQIYEEHRAEIFEQTNRSTFSSNEQGIYDAAIEFEYSMMSDPQTAFEYSEANRSRALLDAVKDTELAHPRSAKINSIPSASVRPLSLGEIRQRIPKNVQILQYSQLENKLYTWVVTSNTFHCAEQHIASERINELVRDYLLEVTSADQSKQEDQRRESAALYDLLIKPVVDLLDPQKVLYIVPDGAMSFLPFGSLISRTSDRYLTEDFAIGTAPSSAVFVLSSERALERTNPKEERLLSVGNPSFDQTAFPELADLPTAELEAKGITQYYSSAKLLTRNLASKSSVLDGLSRANVIHLATHSVQDALNPMRWRVVLAKIDSPADGKRDVSSDTVESQEISSLNLSQASLVVLSSCQTARGRSLRGEGTMSLARSFIAAGAPVVVATLWSVDSEATAELMTSFHRYRKQERLSTVEALRRSQLEMIKNPNPSRRLPYYWAAFNAIGGYTVN